VLATLVSLIGSVKHKSQLAGLGVISGLALSSETAARKLLTKDLLTALKVCSPVSVCLNALMLPRSSNKCRCQGAPRNGQQCLLLQMLSNGEPNSLAVVFCFLSGSLCHRDEGWEADRLSIWDPSVS